MSADKTVTVTLRVCMWRAFSGIRHAGMSLEMALAGFPNGRIGRRRVSRREREQRRLDIARRYAAEDPHLDVQVITGFDGVCRVVVHRVGDWGCPNPDCTVHNLKLARADADRREGTAGKRPPLLPARGTAPSTGRDNSPGARSGGGVGSGESALTQAAQERLDQALEHAVVVGDGDADLPDERSHP